MDEQLRQRLNAKLLDANLSKDIAPDEDIDTTSVAPLDVIPNDEYMYLREQPRFSTLEAIITDPGKLALVLLFGVSIYALYVLNKKS